MDQTGVSSISAAISSSPAIRDQIVSNASSPRFLAAFCRSGFFLGDVLFTFRGGRHLHHVSRRFGPWDEILKHAAHELSSFYPACAILAGVYPSRNRLDLVCQRQTAVHAGTSRQARHKRSLAAVAMIHEPELPPLRKNPTKYFIKTPLACHHQIPLLPRPNFLLPDLCLPAFGYLLFAAFYFLQSASC